MEISSDDDDNLNENNSKNNASCCVFCLLNVSKYKCPRCNAGYCSAQCYKSEKHLQCSESFYKDCVVEGLSDYMASPEERQKMVETLKNMQDDNHEYLDDDDDDVDEADLADRLQGLNLDYDTDQIWERLTKSEKEEFQKMISNGQFGGIIEIWTPWWNYKDKRKVKDIEEEEENRFNEKPPVKENIPLISELLRNSPPSPKIKYTIISVLYAYVYICRLHNGDHLSTSVDSAKTLLELCDALRTSPTHNSVSEAIHSCLYKADGDPSSSQISLKFKLSLIKDIIHIIEGPESTPSIEYLMAAFSDLYTLWQQAIREISQDVKKAKSNEKLVSSLKMKKKSFFRIEKKIEFLMSWSKSCGADLQSCLEELNLEFCALSSEMASITNTKQQFEKKWGGKRPAEKKILIEELT